ncbi:MAG: right-handed parallel beta-helix repeat-containing protein [Candidatus Thorarchaeota archaeon]
MEEQVLRLKRVLVGLLSLLKILLPSSFVLAGGIQSWTVIVTQSHQYNPSQIRTELIVIDDDADFWALGASGVGSRGDPYIVENLLMSTNGTCITVTGITSFFVIKNCVLESDPNAPVIQFNNVENGQIYLCEIAGGSSGVEFLNTVDCTISNSTIYECLIGIQMDLTQNCTIISSRIFHNQRGLFFNSGEFTRIENNTIFSNIENGLEFVWPTNNNTVVGNRFGWNGFGGTDENAVDHGEENRFDDEISRGNAWSDFNGTAPYAIFGTSGSNDSFPILLEDTVYPTFLTRWI